MGRRYVALMRHLCSKPQQNSTKTPSDPTTLDTGERYYVVLNRRKSITIQDLGSTDGRHGHRQPFREMPRHTGLT